MILLVEQKPRHLTQIWNVSCTCKKRFKSTLSLYCAASEISSTKVMYSLHYTTNTQCFASRLENNTSTFFFEICSILIENHASCFTLFSFTKNQQFKLLKVFICTPCLKSVCISPTCTFVAKYSSVRKRKRKKRLSFQFPMRIGVVVNTCKSAL